MPSLRIMLTAMLGVMLALTLAGCGASGDVDTGDTVDTGSAGDADQEASLADLEGGFGGRDKLVDGFPDDVPLPAGTFVLSTIETVDGRDVLVAEITNPAELDSADVTAWYEATLQDAGYSIVESTVAIHNIVRGNKVYDARIEASGSGGRTVTVYLGPDDYKPGLRFWVDVGVPE